MSEGRGGAPPKSKRLKRRTSFIGAAVGAVMGLAGLGRGQPLEGEEEEQEDGEEPAPSAEQPKDVSAVTAFLRGNDESASCAAAAAAAAAAASAVSRPPARSRGSRLTLQQAAHAALRALGDSSRSLDDAAGAADSQDATSGRGNPAAEEEEDENATRKGKGKGKRKREGEGSTVIKTETVGSTGVAAGLHFTVPDWTEERALGSLCYDRKPLMSMRVAELKEALAIAGLSAAGKQPDLRIRLARRLCSDLAKGTPGSASIKGFEAAGAAGPGMVLHTAPATAEERSARGARLQRRRTSTMLKKGPDTKDKPIVISGSDDDESSAGGGDNDGDDKEDTPQARSAPPGAFASVPSGVDTPAEAAEAAAASYVAVASVATSGRRAKRAGTATEAAETLQKTPQEVPRDGTKASKTKALSKALVDGPTPGMPFAELQKAVKALGLKPKGRKRSDLEKCWRQAATAAVKHEEDEEETADESDKAAPKEGEKLEASAEAGRRGRGTRPVPAVSPGPSLGGIAVKDMKMNMLRSHIDRMGLEVSGRLKSDLQERLCSALREGHDSASGSGEHARRTTAGKVAVISKTRGSRSRGAGSGDGDRDGDDAEMEHGDGEEPRPPFRRGRGKQSEKAADPPAAPSPSVPAALPPGQVRFHNVAVAAMTSEERRKALQELDMPSLRKDDGALAHDLVDALVQRKAEAANGNPRKQAWRGRRVYMMRKAELADMLRDFELNDKGKVEELRTRFRGALRTWAAEEIELPSSKDGSGGGEGAARAEAEDGVEDSSSATSGSGSGRRVQGRGRQTTKRQSSDDAVAPQPKRSRASRQSLSEKAAEEALSAASASRRGRGGRAVPTIITTTTTTTAAPTGMSKRRPPAAKENAAPPERAASPKSKSKSKSKRKPAGSKGGSKSSAKKVGMASVDEVSKAGGIPRPERLDAPAMDDSSNEDAGDAPAPLTSSPSPDRGVGRAQRPGTSNNPEAAPAANGKGECAAKQASVGQQEAATTRSNATKPSALNEGKEGELEDRSTRTEDEGPRQRRGAARRRGDQPDPGANTLPPPRPFYQRRAGEEGEKQPEDGNAHRTSPHQPTKSNPNEKSAEVSSSGKRSDGGDDGDGDAGERRGDGRAGRGGGMGRGGSDGGGSGGGGDDSDGDGDGDGSSNDQGSEEEEEKEKAAQSEEEGEADEEDEAGGKYDAGEAKDVAVVGAWEGLSVAADVDMLVDSGCLGRGGASHFRQSQGKLQAAESGDAADGDADTAPTDVLPESMSQDQMEDVEADADADADGDDVVEQNAVDLAGQGSEDDITQEAVEERQAGGEEEGEGNTDEEDVNEDAAEVSAAGSTAGDSAGHYHVDENEELGEIEGGGVEGEIFEGEAEGEGEGAEEEEGDENDDDEDDSVVSAREAAVATAAEEDADGDGDGDGDADADVAGDQASTSTDLDNPHPDQDGVGNANSAGAAMAPQPSDDDADVVIGGEDNGEGAGDVDIAGGSPERSSTDEGVDQIAGQEQEGSDVTSERASHQDQDFKEEEEERQEEEQEEEEQEEEVEAEEEEDEEAEEQEEEAMSESEAQDIVESYGDPAGGTIEIDDSSEEEHGQEQEQEADDAPSPMDRADQAEQNGPNRREQDHRDEEMPGLGPSTSPLRPAAGSADAAGAYPAEGKAGDEEARHDVRRPKESPLPVYPDKAPEAVGAGAGATADESGVLSGSASPGPEQVVGAAGGRELLEACAATATAAVPSFPESKEGSTTGPGARVQASIEDAGVGFVFGSSTQDENDADDADQGAESAQQAAAKEKEEQIHNDFLAMLGERSYREKRDTLDYLANPTGTTRPENPRLPVLFAEQKQATLRVGRSVDSWPREVIMNVDYEGLSSDLADERLSAIETTAARARHDWRSAGSREWVELVPPMKRRIQQQPAGRPGGGGGSGRDRSPWERRGRAGSAFRVFEVGSPAEMGGNAKRPRLGPKPAPGYDADELTPMLRRLDEQDRHAAAIVAAGARRPLPDGSASPSLCSHQGASAALVSTAAAPATSARGGGTPSRTPWFGRVGSSLGREVLRGRRRSSSASVLRYRKSRDFTPRRRPPLAGAGEQRFGAGTLGDWLGGGDASGSKRASLGRVGEASSSASRQRRADGHGPNGQESPRHGAPLAEAVAAAACSKRAGSFFSSASLGLAGMNATPRKALLEEAISEEGEKLARRVEAEAKATAEVGNILMAVVSRENKERDMTRQVRDEQALRARSKQKEEQEGVNTGQVGDQRVSREQEQRREQEKGKDRSSQPLTTASFTFTSTSPAESQRQHLPQHKPLELQVADQSQGSEFDFKNALVSARLHREGDVTADGGGDSMAIITADPNADFVFGMAPPRRAPLRPGAQPLFRFSEATPLKRTAFARERAAAAAEGTLALAPNYDNNPGANALPQGVFEFSMEPRKARKTRRGAVTGKTAAEQMPMAPLAVAPSTTTTATNSMAAPSAPASKTPPITNGFDMSMFKKPGEWKCDACLVRNGPADTTCASCETPKPGASSTATARSGGILGDVIASASAAPSFSFGVKPMQHPGGGGSTPAFTFGGGGGAVDGASAPAQAPAAPAPITNGFDMSKFKNPGEWKCDACLVRNGPAETKCLSCETPKPGTSGAPAAASGGILGSGAASSTPSFTFGVLPAAAGSPASSSSSPSPFSFSAQPSASFAASSTNDTGAAPKTLITFGAQPAAALAGPTASSTAPITNGFDMSKFKNPGEWKCDASLVRNGSADTRCASCETPKPGAGGAGAAASGNSGAGAGSSSAAAAAASTSAPKFSFGVQPSSGSAGASPSPFTFGAAVPAPSQPATSMASTASAAPAFSFGAGSLPAPAGSSSATPTFSFGSGSPPAAAGSASVAAGSAVFSFGSGSLPAPAGNTSGTPTFSFGSGSPPAPASNTSGAPAFSFGSRSSPAPACNSSAAPAPGSVFTFGAGGGDGGGGSTGGATTSSSSVPGSSPPALRFSFGKK